MLPLILKNDWIWLITEIYPSAWLSPSVLYFRRVGVYFCVIGFLSLCQTLVYLIFQKSSRKKEKEKQTCKGCNESFNFTKRKHHCKSCGAVSARLGLFRGNEGTRGEVITTLSFCRPSAQSVQKPWTTRPAGFAQSASKQVSAWRTSAWVSRRGKRHLR